MFISDSLIYMDYNSPKSKPSGDSPRRTPLAVARGLRELADDVATWRKLRGLTQAQLADRANVTPGTLARLEHGHGGMSTENLLRVLRALGVLDLLHSALDPYESDVGRLRADQRLPRRVRPRSLTQARGANRPRRSDG
jgi:transcriptional regulator with XRE-family HTH domain